ncbi:MAG: 2'-5' RNA ligase family protein [Chitinophagaceae bacterium]
MENEILSLPGYRECEFLLVLQPHEDLWNKIMQIKKEFAKDYDCAMAEKLKPHITLAMFQQYEMMEEKIINRLKLITMGLPAFKVELKDFGSFPSHTIYINILSKIPIVNTVKELRQAQRLMKIDNDRKPYFITEPHLTIARKLLPWQYEKAWLEYSNKNFTSRFIADYIVLLKRRSGEKGYQIAARFAFQNLPVVTKQGELF